MARKGREAQERNPARKRRRAEKTAATLTKGAEKFQRDP